MLNQTCGVYPLYEEKAEKLTRRIFRPSAPVGEQGRDRLLWAGDRIADGPTMTNSMRNDMVTCGSTAVQRTVRCTPSLARGDRDEDRFVHGPARDSDERRLRYLKWGATSWKDRSRALCHAVIPVCAVDQHGRPVAGGVWVP